MQPMSQWRAGPTCIDYTTMEARSTKTGSLSAPITLRLDSYDSGGTIWTSLQAECAGYKFGGSPYDYGDGRGIQPRP
jgi:hypothetical protein